MEDTGYLGGSPSSFTYPEIFNGVMRSVRALTPASHSITIQPFSKFSELMDGGPRCDVYKSNTFDVEGYKWKLLLYPHGDKQRNAEGYVSLYLLMMGLEAMPVGWEVHVNFKMFVHDKIRDNYLTIQDVDGGFTRFYQQKAKHGYSHLIREATFCDPSEGYVVDDECTFGVEIFVEKSMAAKKECCISAPRFDPQDYEWPITGFSKVKDDIICSPVFTIGGKDWMLKVDPNVIHGRKRYLSICLVLVSATPPKTTYSRLKRRLENFYMGPKGETIYFGGSIGVTNAVHEVEHMSPLSVIFSMKNYCFWRATLELKDLWDRGFIEDDTLLVVASFNAMLVKTNVGCYFTG